MQFGAWMPVETALSGGASADRPPLPSGPGVFQLRVEKGLLRYPHGQSAMVAYGAGSDVVTALAALLSGPVGDHARRLGPLLCRFAAPDPHCPPHEHLRRLHERFRAQFGSLPLAEAAAAATNP
jgi:hypothetical protein